MLASGKTQGMLMEYLLISPPTEWMQLSQVPAICNPRPSDPKSSVLQAEIGKILLAKSAAGSSHITEYGPNIQNLWATTAFTMHKVVFQR